MKRCALLLVIVGLIGVYGFGQNDRGTRARVAPTPAPSSPSVAPSLQNDVPEPSGTNRRPPVLANDTRVRPSAQNPTVSPTPPVSEEDEIVKVETNLVTMPVSV